MCPETGPSFLQTIFSVFRILHFGRCPKVSAQLQTGLEESSKIAEEGLEEGKRMSKATADETQRRKR